jgi:hypothetical protein
MRSLVLPTLALSLLASTARADELVATDAKPASVVETKPAPRFALAVNFPLGWIGARSIGGSFYAGVSNNDAIRVNVASYENTASAVGEIIGIAAGGDGDEADRSGRTLDLGVGIVHYSRALWDGFTMEAGALRRARDIRVTDDFASSYSVATDTTTYAGRALFGWSWLIQKRVFIAAAIGGSAGIETGTEKTENDLGEMMKTNKVDRSDVSFEGYLRFGGAF